MTKQTKNTKELKEKINKIIDIADDAYQMGDDEWEEEYGEIDYREVLFGVIVDLIHQEREKIVGEIDKIIVHRMREYANAKLSKRLNAFDELAELRKEIDQL